MDITEHLKAIESLKKVIGILSKRIDVLRNAVAELEKDASIAVAQEDAVAPNALKSAQPEPEHAGSASDAILAIVDNAKGAPVSIPTIASKLKARGVNTTKGSLSVALSRLKKSGSIATAGRGRYARP